LAVAFVVAVVVVVVVTEDDYWPEDPNEFPQASKPEGHKVLLQGNVA